MIPKKFPGPPEYDLTGRTFSWLTVIGYAGSKDNADGSKWWCKCICGNTEIRRSQRLKRQRSDRDYFCQECEDKINNQRYEEYLNLFAEQKFV